MASQQAQIRSLTAKLSRTKKALEKVRDDLREIRDEAEDLLDTVDRGGESLADAIDALSELV